MAEKTLTASVDEIVALAQVTMWLQIGLQEMNGAVEADNTDRATALFGLMLEHPCATRDLLTAQGLMDRVLVEVFGRDPATHREAVRRDLVEHADQVVTEMEKARLFS